MTERRAAVLGSPIAHSLSPALHRAAYAALGLDWTYDAIECDEAALPGLLAGLDDSWAGLSLTMPLKRAVLPLVDACSPLVELVGAANTVLMDKGRTFADNTDVYGIRAALGELGGPDAGSVTVVGGGATATSALAALAERGYPPVTVVARSAQRSGALLAAADRLGVPVRLRSWPGEPSDWAVDVVISTVPGAGTEALAAQLPGVPRALLDVAYTPWPTPLAAAAAAAGAAVVSGLAVLVHQAARQVELMTGRPAPLAAMRAAVDPARLA